MSLTDEGLAAIKHQHAKTIHTREYPTRCGICNLFARLDAAEKACLFFQNSLRLGNVDDGVLSEWRKAAGK